MPDHEVIDMLKQLLKIHRLTLLHYLQQQAILGTAYMPPGVTHGIIEARDNIHRIKKMLRERNIYVENEPFDEEDDSLITSRLLDITRDNPSVEL